MFSPFQVSPSETPYPIPPPLASMRVLSHPIIHPLPSSCLSIPLHWGIKHPQAQGPLLPLMSNKAILCHICGQCHGLLHVYSLVGGPVPGSSRGSGLLTLLLPPWGCKPPQLLQSLLQLLHQGPMVGCKHLSLYLSVSGRAFQETAISSSHLQSKHFPALTIASKFGDCI